MLLSSNGSYFFNFKLQQTTHFPKPKNNSEVKLEPPNKCDLHISSSMWKDRIERVKKQHRRTIDSLLSLFYGGKS